MQNLFRVISTALFLTSLCAAANVSDHLVGVHGSSHSLSFAKIKGQDVPYPALQGHEAYSSGICIDKTCSIVATAHHVQMLAGRALLRVTGGLTEKVLSPASDIDSNKATIPIAKSQRTLSCNIANDVSFVYTKKPIPHKSGLSHSYNFYVGQKVQVAGYHDRKFETKGASIIGANVKLVIGVVQLSDNIILDISLDPGDSGSAVLDEQGTLLGMIVLTGTVKLRGNDVTASVALPVKTIARALVEVDPVLGLSVFNDIPKEEPKPTQPEYVVYQDSDLPEDTSPIIPDVSVAPIDAIDPVGNLRAKSEVASKLMVDFIAKQCLVQGTQKPLCHELAYVDGQQIFRKIGADGKVGKPRNSFPAQKHGVWTQSDWADTLSEIADNPWVFQGAVDDHYLFTFEAAAEEERCDYEEYSQGIPLFGGGHPGWKGSVDCFEAVLTDRSLNVLSVFAEMHPPDDCLTRVIQTALYFDWVTLEGIKSPILVPVKERIAAKVRGQKDLWYANVTWTGYEKFRAQHRMRF